MAGVGEGMRKGLRVARAMAVKDMKVSLRDRVFLAVGITVPVNLLVIALLLALNGGEAPVAVVVQDHGPLAARFVDSMRHAHSFKISETDASGAERLIRGGNIVAVITVPPDFDSALAAGRRVELPVEVNNLDVDFTNDIRRAVPLSISTFYATAFPGEVAVRAHEIDKYSLDTGYVPYIGVSIVVVALMVGGLVQGGMNSARDFEMGTIKEVLLSPASRWAVGLGKVAGALVLTLPGAIVVLLVVMLLLGVRPISPVEFLSSALLLLVAFAALGTFLGTLLRRRQVTFPLVLGIFLPLFIASGPFGPANWQGPAATVIATISPLYYAIAVFQHAFHGYRTSQPTLQVDVVALAVFAVASAMLTAVTLRRATVSH